MKSPKRRLVPAKLAGCLAGANPIIWSNDDFSDLAGDVPLDTILSQMKAAGYSGSELGHAYPRSPAALADALGRHNLRLVSGWHSTYLASRDRASQEASFRTLLNLLKTLGARVAIVAECTRSIHGESRIPLGFGEAATPRLTKAEWPRLVAGLRRLSKVAAAEDITIVYHHHMGTVIQAEDDLDRLMGSVPEISLLLDPGHLFFAGIDPVALAKRYAARIRHVHLKSVRPSVAKEARERSWSFYRSVANGVFTIPGEGGVDFPAIFKCLASVGYNGWLVAEAEEDPARVPALPKARLARNFIRRHAGV
ncbi:MAG TPA: myo-inosose-2 dehydratase [Opitutaceae bacterium]|jgi:myo-inosose-2 dehydratase